MVAFKNFSLHSLLFELSLIVSVAIEEDAKKHLLLARTWSNVLAHRGLSLIQPGNTVIVSCWTILHHSSLTNTAWEYSSAKDLYFPMTDLRTKTNLRNTLPFFSSKDNNVWVFFLPLKLKNSKKQCVCNSKHLKSFAIQGTKAQHPFPEVKFPGPQNTSASVSSTCTLVSLV